jgi:hypothetical protein
MTTANTIATLIILLLVSIFILHVVTNGGWTGGWDWVKSKFVIAKA